MVRVGVAECGRSLQGLLGAIGCFGVLGTSPIRGLSLAPALPASAFFARQVDALAKAGSVVVAARIHVRCDTDERALLLVRVDEGRDTVRTLRVQNRFVGKEVGAAIFRRATCRSAIL